MNFPIALYLAVLVSGSSGNALAPEQTALNRGDKLLQTHCKGCHAIGLKGASTHPKAPPFRDVMQRYPANNLAEALAEGIVSGHPAMPEFVFSVSEIDQIIRYLDTLK